ncbi:hypothetical protein [Clostridium manihotivorum]|uniref:Uncharacterized protein n=1 Tax=Clostridium manihotivorum TaxID=2320868 RepID=A0A3R5TCP2_9CLOT|nr:hypothetical protein [Clostridium manihotivorum]QAA30242.1 hypothetical protein C1I91_00255 [Clostridium manihotivorum]
MSINNLFKGYKKIIVVILIPILITIVAMAVTRVFFKSDSREKIGVAANTSESSEIKLDEINSTDSKFHPLNELNYRFIIEVPKIYSAKDIYKNGNDRYIIAKKNGDKGLVLYDVNRKNETSLISPTAEGYEIIDAKYDGKWIVWSERVENPKSISSTKRYSWRILCKELDLKNLNDKRTPKTLSEGSYLKKWSQDISLPAINLNNGVATALSVNLKDENTNISQILMLNLEAGSLKELKSEEIWGNNYPKVSVPNIYEDNIIWSENKTEKKLVREEYIYAYNVKSNELRLITDKSINGAFGGYKQYLVFTEANKVSIYNLNNEKSKDILNKNLSVLTEKYKTNIAAFNISSIYVSKSFVFFKPDSKHITAYGLKDNKLFDLTEGLGTNYGRITSVVCNDNLIYISGYDKEDDKKSFFVEIN